MSFPKLVIADVLLTYGRNQKSYQQFKLNAQKATKDLGHAAEVDNLVVNIHGLRSAV
jgi:hypothetical protein